MNPLKGGRFDIHFHRRDAEHAEDLFNFLLSAETRLTRLSPPASQALRAGESDGGQGAESKNQQPLGASTPTLQKPEGFRVKASRVKL